MNTKLMACAFMIGAWLLAGGGCADFLDDDSPPSGTPLSAADVKFVGTDFGRVGIPVSGAGDVNGDGFADILIGARRVGSQGTVYLFYGSASVFSTGTVDFSTADVVFVGEAPGGEAIGGVSAGDVNGDGFDDMLIGALDSAGKGIVYLVYGASSGLGGNIDLATANLKFSTEQVGGTRPSLSGAGDVNGNGYDDFLVGDTWQGSGGTVYLFYGPPLGPNQP